MLEILTGSGLATAAGLNAYIPMLVLGLLDRFTSLVELPTAWQWLSHDVTLWILAALLVLEVVADKIPVLDSVNDAVQTVIRPAAGGITFASGVGTQTVTVQDPGALFAGEAWIPVVIGAGLALLVHLFKATTRASANTVTAGAAAPVLSTAEDTASTLLALTAVFLPVAVVVLLILVLVGLWLLGRWVLGRRRRDRLMSPEDRYFSA
jgi:hypothetical protein